MSIHFPTDGKDSLVLGPVMSYLLSNNIALYVF